MAEDPKNNTLSESEDGIFKDLLSDSRISSLNISEPQFDSFDVQSAIQEAKTVAKTPKNSRNPFGKRRSRSKTAEPAPVKEEPVQLKPAQPAETIETTVTIDETQEESAPVEREITLEEVLAGNFKDDVTEEEQIISIDQQPVPEPVIVHEPEPKPVKPDNKSEEVVLNEETLLQTPAVEEKAEEEVPPKPRTFAEILNSTRYQQNQQALEHLDLMEDSSLQNAFVDSQAVNEEFESEKNAQSSSVLITKQEPGASYIAQEEMSEEEPETVEIEEEITEKEKPLPKKGNKRGSKHKRNRNDVIDPDASIVDDYAYDEYQDKKHFFTSDYKQIEEYLAGESAQGYHYTHKDGNRYFFVKKKPRNYLYKVLYFADEPDDSYWEMLESEGWDRVDRSPSRHKRDAGWYILRHLQKEGDLPVDIPNEEEKYRYFSKLASSCRSTMLLLTIVMICSAIAIFLQYYFKGFIAVMIGSAILFAIALYFFVIYARMLTKARKQTSLLAARVRLSENNEQYQALRQAPRDQAYYQEPVEDDYDDYDDYEE